MAVSYTHLDVYKRQEFAHPVTVVAGAYDPALFFDAVKGLEAEKEGGARCERCFRLRLMEAARLAKDGGYDYFTTTLTVGPKKMCIRDKERTDQ